MKFTNSTWFYFREMQALKLERFLKKNHMLKKWSKVFIPRKISK